MFFILPDSSFKSVKSFSIDNGEPCPNCKRAYSLEGELFYEVWEIASVSIVPVNKLRSVYCTSCETTFDHRMITGDLKEAFKECAQKVETSSWDFFRKILLAPILWSVLVIGLIMILFTLYNLSVEKQKQYLEAPLQGDIYYILDENRWTTFLKVIDIKSDTVYVVRANYAFKGDQITHNELNGYSDAWVEEFPSKYSRDERFELGKQGILKKVIRPSQDLLHR
ncbi:MAG: hypothetical protein AB8F95_08370 [Bacteroidia bacterium]